MVPADGAPRGEAQFGVEVEERLAVADDLSFRPLGSVRSQAYLPAPSKAMS